MTTKTADAPVAVAKPDQAPAAAAPATPAVKDAAPVAGGEVKQPAAADPAKPAAKPAEAKPAEAKALPALGDEPKEGEVPALGEAAEAAKDEAKASKPIEYDFGQPPEGLEYRASVIDVYKAALAKHKVEPAVAKDLLDTVLPAIQSDIQAQGQAHLAQTEEKWKAELQTRHGDKLKDVMRQAGRAFAAATPELQSLILGSALAWNPDLIDLLAQFAGLFTNDRTVKSNATAPAKQLAPLEEIAAGYEANEAARNAAKARG